MHKIQRVSQIFYGLFLLALFMMPVFCLLSWVIGPELIQSGGANFLFSMLPDQRFDFDFTVMPTYVRIIGFCISIIPMTISMLVLWHFVKLFHLYKQGHIFSVTHVNYIRRIGVILLIGQLLDPLYQILMSFLLSVSAAAIAKNQQYSFSFSFGTDNINTIITASLIILIAWIMGEAYKLQRDQQLTI